MGALILLLCLNNIITEALQQTHDKLQFSMTNELVSFDQLNTDQKIKTHCVGYCRVFTHLCNKKFEENNLPAKARQERRQIYLGNINCTKLISSFFYKIGYTRMGNFCKDHDIVIIEYENKEIIIDPLIPKFITRFISFE